jgi:2-iminobutanoate/2-iminopropanoate deaminase
LNRFDLKAKVPALLNFVKLRETFENKEFLIMTKQVLNVPNAPKYPFSPAIRAGDYIFVSGQGGFQNPKTGEAIEGIEAQTRQCLENMKQILEMAGASLADVVKVTIFLGNVADYAKMNEVYQSYFPKDQPARSAAVTGLVMPNMLIEMECIAYRP